MGRLNTARVMGSWSRGGLHPPGDYHLQYRESLGEIKEATDAYEDDGMHHSYGPWRFTSSTISTISISCKRTVRGDLELEDAATSALVHPFPVLRGTSHFPEWTGEGQQTRSIRRGLKAFAKKADGYFGADERALCTESALGLAARNPANGR